MHLSTLQRQTYYYELPKHLLFLILNHFVFLSINLQRFEKKSTIYIHNITGFVYTYILILIQTQDKIKALNALFTAHANTVLTHS